ncbi:MAG: glyceraldehyde-3-phosphate dehydrogenase [Planctomycetes bacterium]|nr:glyceraldehyde-3-phosphate dehydrogenase [Planctomycetota bacterium]
MRVAINGLGRMGRLFLRAALPVGVDVVLVNEPLGDAETLALGIEFDSVQGRYHLPARSDGDRLLVGEHAIDRIRVGTFEELPWREHGIDLVVDCSGRSKELERCRVHLDRGARRLLVSNPVKGVPNLVYGVNHDAFDLAAEPIVTAASCTTNCLAPVVRVLHDAIGIERGAVTTLHDPTNTQVVVDRPHKDPRRARSALVNLIPTSTNSATAVTMIVPELQGKLDSIAVRVPVLNASLTDCAFQMQRETSVDEVLGALRAAAAGRLRGVLGVEDRPLVSSDYANDPRSGIVDGGCTRVIDGRMVKLMVWYDNEWGYANRMVDLVRCIRETLG